MKPFKTLGGTGNKFDNNNNNALVVGPQIYGVDCDFIFFPPQMSLSQT